MKLHASLLAAACALALSACGGNAPPADTTTGSAPGPATDAPASPGDAEKVEPASIPEAPMGQTPADGTAPASGDTGDTAGDGAGTEGAEVAPPAAADASADTGEAAVTGCSIELEGNDMMKFNVSSITVPASCSQFTINLTHTGRLPVAAMGHNVVVTAASDMAGVAADGIAAGAAAGYLKAGDSRVIAHTEMVGGGGTSSVTFDVSKIKDGGPYEFFCSFPGHAALMKGTIGVG